MRCQSLQRSTVRDSAVDCDGRGVARRDRLAPGGGMMTVDEFECAACGERFEVQRPMCNHDRLKEQAPTLPEVWEDRHSPTGLGLQL